MLSWKEESPSVWVIHDGVLLHSVSYLHLFWETILARSLASLKIYISPLQPLSLVILHAFGASDSIRSSRGPPFFLSKALCERFTYTSSLVSVLPALYSFETI